MLIQNLYEANVLGKLTDKRYHMLSQQYEKEQAELEQMVERTFEGSLPAFIAAFSRSKKLSAAEVAQLREMIDSYEEK